MGPRAMSAHEIFAAQTAREMVEGGDWINPTYNGQSRLKKPPLMYWLQASLSVALKRLGIGSGRVEPWEARLPSALAGALIAGLTVLLGRRVYGEVTGITAGLVVMGCLGFVEYGRSARPDMVYGACCAAALLGWVSATLPERGEKARRRDALFGWAWAGVATLAKGPHVPAILALGVVAHLLIAKRRREVVPALRPLAGIAVMLGICAPWVVAVVMGNSGAAGVWARQMFAGRAGADELSVLAWLTPFYVYEIPKLVLPWAVTLPFGMFVAFVKGRKDLAPGRALVWVVLVTAGVMSLSNHRRDYYMLPILAPLGVLMARGTMDWLDRMLQRDGFRRRIIGALCALFAALACGLAWRAATAGTEVMPRATEAAGALALVGLAAWLWRWSGAEAEGLARLAAGGVIVVFLATAGDPITRDRYAGVAQRFAERVQEIVDRRGERAPLALYRMPDAGVVYAQVVYTLGRVIPEAENSEALASIAGEGGEVWAVLRMNHLPEVSERWVAVVEADTPSDDKGEARIALVRLRAKR